MSAAAGATTVTGPLYTSGGPASCTVTAINSASLKATSAATTSTLAFV